MSDKDEETEEPIDDEPEVSSGRKEKGQRQPFINLRRELSEEELSNSGVQKMMLAEVERLDAENDKLQDVQLQYHQKDKQVAVFEEKFKAKVAIEVISTGMITVGSVLLGLAYGAWDKAPLGLFFLASGVALVILAVVAKAIKS
ncbi:hypothetical protein [Roseovarius ramblicola]|uniref:DUF2335 domain-containing protein n=1 Tax=Roseovarius ramblicola TaxID=2022336 RepID=A0ABV5I2Y4_9RHOB